MVARFWILITAFVMFGRCLSVAQAQPVDFTCPKAGTVEIRPLGTIRDTGASTNDPYVCTSLGYAGKRFSLLFGIYRTEGPDIALIRPAMLELFSGRKTSVSFGFTNPDQVHLHHTWTFLRRETITVAGKARDTMAFDLEIQAERRQGGYNLLHALFWFDPMDGIWIKRQLHLISGTYQGNSPDYEDISIVVPE
jgi:hypothetical protein